MSQLFMVNGQWVSMDVMRKITEDELAAKELSSKNLDASSESVEEVEKPLSKASQAKLEREKRKAERKRS